MAEPNPQGAPSPPWCPSYVCVLSTDVWLVCWCDVGVLTAMLAGTAAVALVLCWLVQVLLSVCAGARAGHVSESGCLVKWRQVIVEGEGATLSPRSPSVRGGERELPSSLLDCLDKGVRKLSPHPVVCCGIDIDVVPLTCWHWAGWGDCVHWCRCWLSQCPQGAGKGRGICLAHRQARAPLRTCWLSWC